MKIKTLLFILFVLLIVSASGQTGVTIGPESLDLILSHYTNQLVDTLEININNGSDVPLEWELSVQADQVCFTKENYADWGLPENQDFITESVVLTRGNDEGLFNIAQESSYNSSSETPAGTEWASMSTANADPEDYGTWRGKAHPYGDGGIGKTVSLHLIEEDLYFDVVFHSWTSGKDEGGGGFSYTRVNTNPGWLKVSITSDTTASGENQIVKVAFNAEELKKGDYFAEIVINTSDMFLYHVKLPVHLTVEGPSPEMSVDPESFMTTLSHYTGILEETQTLTIQNVGDGPLEVKLTGRGEGLFGKFFEKKNYADCTLPENQDRIADSVWITRADEEGLFNAARELEYSYSNGGPAGTEWASMPTLEAGPDDYGSWETYAHPYNDEGALEKVVSLHLIEEDLYYDVVFHSWTSGEDEGGGGFSYTRFSESDGAKLSVEADTIDGGTSLIVDVMLNATDLAVGNYFGEIIIASNDPNNKEIIVPVNLAVDGPTPDIAVSPESLSMTLSGYDKGLEGTQTLTISNNGDDDLKWDLSIHGERAHFKKANYADWKLPENQDFITDSVILTRGNDEGLFNIAQESFYNWSAETPAGTEWASMATAEAEPEDYGTWRDNAHPYGYGGIGKIVSLHLIEEDLYFDVVFHSWTSGEDEGGGGFSYTRTIASRNWISTSDSLGVVGPGSSANIDVNFKALDLEHGDYYTGIWIHSNDQDEPVVEVPVHMFVDRPHPEINLVPDSVKASLSQYTGVLTDTQRVTITNTGDAPLELDLNLRAITFIGEFFEKPDNADWTLPENQDSISPNCIITRADNMGLFNIASEAQYNRFTSPASTEWANGPTVTMSPYNYGYWAASVHPIHQQTINKIVSLYVIEDDLYFDVMFHSWTSNNNGGGFSYTRASDVPSWVTISHTADTLAAGESLDLDVTFNAESLERGNYFADVIVENNVPGTPKIVIPTHLFLDGPAPQIVVTPDSLSSTLSYYTGTLSEIKPLVISNTGDKNLEWEITVFGPPVTFTKPNYADWTKPEFQDRITENVILTRANEGGLFNIAQEFEYLRDRKIDVGGESPLGTEWASMPTAEADSEDYGAWRDYAHPYRDGGIGKTVSLHLIEDDLYFDVVFHSWTSGEKEGGGGFFYTRVRVNPSWIKASVTVDTTADSMLRI